MSDAPSPAGPLARLRAQLAGPRGARRVDALLSCNDAEGAVAALTVTELYEVVAEVGLHEASDIVQLATPSQIRGCLDLEIWDRDKPLMDLAKPWFATVLEAGFEKFGQVWAALDPEWRALFLQRYTKVWDLTLGEEPWDDDKPMYFTVDRFFCLEIRADEDTVRLITQILDDLYRADPDLARHTIMVARSEAAIDLEEDSLRWRTGRLADLGYVDYYDALDLFRPLEADAVKIGEGTEDRMGQVIDTDDPFAHLPVVLAEQVMARSFLARAWDRLDAHGEEARLEAALMVVVNKLLSAARIRPGDQPGLRAGADYATSTISLGLEVVSKGDLDRAAAALRSVSLGRLFRAGYTVGAKLARLAHGLAPRAATAGEIDLAVIGALIQPRPWFARVFDQEGGGHGVRPFETPTDVRRVAELLARLTLRLAVAESLGVNLLAMGELPEPRPDLDDHARTAITRCIAGGELVPRALSHDELRAARTTLEHGRLPAASRARAQSALLGHLDGARIHATGGPLLDLIDGWLAEIEALLRPLDPAKIDPRYIGGVLIETTGGARA